MTEGFVADATLGVSWVIASQSDEGTERLRDAAIKGSAIVVPIIWTLEVTNTLMMFMRRTKITRVQWLQALHQISLASFVIDDEAIRLAFKEISLLAEQYALTTYDATYLELAIRRKLPLATRDVALNNAARKCGVKTLL